MKLFLTAIPPLALLLLTAHAWRDDVFSRSRERVSPILKCDSAAGCVVRSILGAETGHDDHSTGQQIFLPDPASRQQAGRAAGETPVGDLPRDFIFHIDVKPDVGIHPL